MRDPLTGLYNRRFLTDSLLRALDERRHTGAPLSIVSFDVDHFKKFNDNFGHDAGDRVLRDIADILTDETRGSDIACRNGGEEFMLVWPGMDTQAAFERTERIRERVKSHTVIHGGGTLPPVTISLGVASYGVHGTGIQELMRAADDAMYNAKRAGRDRSVVAATSNDERADYDDPSPASSMHLTVVSE